MTSQILLITIFINIKTINVTVTCLYCHLTLPVPYISGSCIEIKIKSNVYLHTSLWCLKRFDEGLIKPFEAPQRKVKIKI